MKAHHPKHLVRLPQKQALLTLFLSYLTEYEHMIGARRKQRLCGAAIDVHV